VGKESVEPAVDLFIFEWNQNLPQAGDSGLLYLSSFSTGFFTYPNPCQLPGFKRIYAGLLSQSV